MNNVDPGPSPSLHGGGSALGGHEHGRHGTRTVLLEGSNGESHRWDPAQVAGNRGGSEVYRSEEIELRAGDRIRWTRNDAGLGLVNSRTADVLSVEHGRVSFRLEDGRTMELDRDDSVLRHLDHAWASTVHAFQGCTVDNVIAAMEARHPHLTTQKSFYVEISRARDRAELVTDNAGSCAERRGTRCRDNRSIPGSSHGDGPGRPLEWKPFSRKDAGACPAGTPETGRN